MEVLKKKFLSLYNDIVNIKIDLSMTHYDLCKKKYLDLMEDLSLLNISDEQKDDLLDLSFMVIESLDHYKIMMQNFNKTKLQFE